MTCKAMLKETERHTPSILRNLRETPDNYLVLSSIIFSKASVSIVMVGTQQVE
jgi:hypothetical protein